MNSMSVDDMADDKVLTKIATEAGDLKMDEVARTLFQVKPGDEIEESIAKLGKMLQSELAKTYAFLVNKKEKEEEVTKFTKKGLQVMIMNRLKQLMPVGCKKCNKMYLNCREEAPQVMCRMCGIGACPDCFTSEERMNKWTFLCGVCDEEVIHMKGEKALEEKYFKVEKKKKKNAKEAAKKENKVVDEGEEEGEEEEGEEEEEDDEDDVEVIEDPFEEVVPKKKGFRANKVSKKEEPIEKQIPICHHFKKARCHHGLSGKQSFNGVEKCPFRHPKICGRLLRNGDRGRGGCRGQQDGCTEFHQVKMCFSSMKTRKCSQKECKNGYHVKGTVIQQNQQNEEKEAEKKDTEQRPKMKPWEQEKAVEKQPTSDNNVASFLGQMLLQQQEMMQQQQQQAQQQRNEQMQFQQQMLQMISRMGGATESRPVSPMVNNQMGAMLQPGPLSYRQVV